jgi:hypothetical protein
MDLITEQKQICKLYHSPFFDSPEFMKVGISQNVIEGLLPINGLRHPLKGDTTGWYIWAGEYSSDSDFFVTLHVEHLKEWCPKVLKYLGLAPGWRFLLANNYEDVWQDNSLLKV